MNKMIGIYLLQQLNKMRHRDCLCDLELVSNNNDGFKVHHAVFVALNPRYFESYCSAQERQSGAYAAKKKMMMPITSNELKVVVDFMYGIPVTLKSKFDILEKALKKLSIDHLIKEAGGFTFEPEDTVVKTEPVELGDDSVQDHSVSLSRDSLTSLQTIVSTRKKNDTVSVCKKQSNSELNLGFQSDAPTLVTSEVTHERRDEFEKDLDNTQSYVDYTCESINHADTKNDGGQLDSFIETQIDAIFDESSNTENVHDALNIMKNNILKYSQTGSKDSSKTKQSEDGRAQETLNIEKSVRSVQSSSSSVVTEKMFKPILPRPVLTVVVTPVSMEIPQSVSTVIGENCDSLKRPERITQETFQHFLEHEVIQQDSTENLQMKEISKRSRSSLQKLISREKNSKNRYLIEDQNERGYLIKRPVRGKQTKSENSTLNTLKPILKQNYGPVSFVQPLNHLFQSSDTNDDRNRNTDARTEPRLSNTIQIQTIPLTGTVQERHEHETEKLSKTVNEAGQDPFPLLVNDHSVGFNNYVKNQKELCKAECGDKALDLCDEIQRKKTESETESETETNSKNCHSIFSNILDKTFVNENKEVTDDDHDRKEKPSGQTVVFWSKQSTPHSNKDKGIAQNEKMKYLGIVLSNQQEKANSCKEPALSMEIWNGSKNMMDKVCDPCDEIHRKKTDSETETESGSKATKAVELSEKDPCSKKDKTYKCKEAAFSMETWNVSQNMMGKAADHYDENHGKKTESVTEMDLESKATKAVEVSEIDLLAKGVCISNPTGGPNCNKINKMLDHCNKKAIKEVKSHSENNVKVSELDICSKSVCANTLDYQVVSIPEDLIHEFQSPDLKASSNLLRENTNIGNKTDVVEKKIVSDKSDCVENVLENEIINTEKDLGLSHLLSKFPAPNSKIMKLSLNAGGNHEITYDKGRSTCDSSGHDKLKDSTEDVVKSTSTAKCNVPATEILTIPTKPIERKEKRELRKNNLSEPPVLIPKCDLDNDKGKQDSLQTKPSEKIKTLCSNTSELKNILDNKTVSVKLYCLPNTSDRLSNKEYFSSAEKQHIDKERSKGHRENKTKLKIKSVGISSKGCTDCSVAEPYKETTATTEIVQNGVMHNKSDKDFIQSDPFINPNSHCKTDIDLKRRMEKQSVSVKLFRLPEKGSYARKNKSSGKTCLAKESENGNKNSDEQDITFKSNEEIAQTEKTSLVHTKFVTECANYEASSVGRSDANVNVNSESIKHQHLNQEMDNRDKSYSTIKRLISQPLPFTNQNTTKCFAYNRMQNSLHNKLIVPIVPSLASPVPAVTRFPVYLKQGKKAEISICPLVTCGPMSPIIPKPVSSLPELKTVESKTQFLVDPVVEPQTGMNKRKRYESAHSKNEKSVTGREFKRSKNSGVLVENEHKTMKIEPLSSKEIATQDINTTLLQKCSVNIEAADLTVTNDQSVQSTIVSSIQVNKETDTTLQTKDWVTDLEFSDEGLPKKQCKDLDMDTNGMKLEGNLLETKPVTKDKLEIKDSCSSLTPNRCSNMVKQKRSVSDSKLSVKRSVWTYRLKGQKQLYRAKRLKRSLMTKAVDTAAGNVEVVGFGYNPATIKKRTLTFLKNSP